MNGNPVVQLFCDEAAAANGAVLGGASGAPVISGGHIIGHLRRVLPDESDRAQLGLVFACPAVGYESALPSLDALTQFRAPVVHRQTTNPLGTFPGGTQNFWR